MKCPRATEGLVQQQICAIAVFVVNFEMKTATAHIQALWAILIL
jgi:hypothetical protein